MTIAVLATSVIVQHRSGYAASNRQNAPSGAGFVRPQFHAIRPPETPWPDVLALLIISPR
jgi:hypothetical protein